MRALFWISVSLFGVVLEQVIGHILDRVSGALFSTLRKRLEQDRNHCFVQIGSQGQVLHSGVLGSLRSGGDIGGWGGVSGIDLIRHILMSLVYYEIIITISLCHHIWLMVSLKTSNLHLKNNHRLTEQRFWCKPKDHFSATVKKSSHASCRTYWLRRKTTEFNSWDVPICKLSSKRAYLKTICYRLPLWSERTLQRTQKSHLWQNRSSVKKS